MPFDVNWIQAERQTDKQNIRLCIINIIHKRWNLQNLSRGLNPLKPGLK